jgi:cbb3-type cytochrome c oxidase subunit II
MTRHNLHPSGWRGIGLIAITYVYFLIFAQFAFLRRLAQLGISDLHLKAVLAAMACGGIVFSLLAPRLKTLEPGLRVGISLFTCAAAALLSLLPLSLAASILVSLLIGCGLGLLTVTLVTHLRLWIAGTNPLIGVGIGTGLGYFACNLPSLFTATPSTQAIVAAMLCVAGAFLTLGGSPAIEASEGIEAPLRARPFAQVLVSFTALVWLDSAAFFIIQNTPALKAGAWEGTAHLWGNGALHFAAALLSAWLLRRRGLSRTLSFAFAALAFACLLLLNPNKAVLASIFYPVGVSLYSVALVAYPAILSPASSLAERSRRAGWIYAIAGWFGSAMGIGMGQNLGRVPPAFVALAGVLVLGPTLLAILRKRSRELLATVSLLFIAFAIERTIEASRSTATPASGIERGRLVYTSEGCINCHSQYVRPNTADVLMWGPVKTIPELRTHPVVIGNRRQGPDLAEVGSRRSPLWLKAHFYNPSQVSQGSFMPSYAYLFQDSRGDDLIAYLESLTGDEVAQHRAAEQAWQPSTEAIAQANASDGERLFGYYCGTCHFAKGATRLAWQGSFIRLPPVVFRGANLRQDARIPNPRMIRLAQIAKFGVPGTDMPGHEYLRDRDIASISLWLAGNSPLPSPKQTLNTLSGERP